MTVCIAHFNSSCSFDFSGDNGSDDLSLSDWISCKADSRVVHHCPVILNICSDSSFLHSYVITPLPENRCLFTDIEQCASCFFNPYLSADHIADDILEVIDDEELAAITARVIIWLHCPVNSPEFFTS